MWSRDQWDVGCERAISALVLAGVATSAVCFGGVRNPEFAGFSALAFALWLARLWLNPSHRFLLHPALWPLAGFWGYTLWRSVHVTAPYYAAMECIPVTAAVLLFVTTLHNLHRQEITLWATHVLAALGCLIAGYAVLQLLRQSDTVLWMQQPAAYSKRAGGTFVNPNDLAGFLAPLIPLAMANVLLGRVSPMVKVLHGYAALTMIGGVAVTMSRGGWVANCAGIGVMFVWLAVKRPNLRIPIAGVGVLLLAGAVLFFTNVDKARLRLSDAVSGNTIDSGLSRPWLWKPAWAMWMDHFWTGVGPAQFDVEFPAYRPWQVQPHPDRVHNDYLNLFVDYGAIGGGLAMACLGLIAWGAVRTGKFAERTGNDLGRKASNREAFFVGASAGLIGLSAHLTLDFVFHIPAISLTAAVVASLLASNLRFATERHWVTPRLWSRVVVTGAGVALLWWFVPAVARAAREQRILNEVARATRVDAALLKQLEAASLVAPGNPDTAYQLGENLRRLSFEGGPGWRTQAREAVRWLETSVSLNPKDPDARLALARTRQWLGETNQAEADFKLALELGPNSVEIANHVAWHWMTTGRTNEALALFDKSVAWNWYANPMALRYQAELRRAQGK